MPRAIRNAANEVGASADQMSAAVCNVCAWLAVLCERVSKQGIDLAIHRTAEGRFAVNVSIPEIPKPKE